MASRVMEEEAWPKAMDNKDMEASKATDNRAMDSKTMEEWGRAMGNRVMETCSKIMVSKVTEIWGKAIREIMGNSKEDGASNSNKAVGDSKVSNREDGDVIVDA